MIKRLLFGFLWFIGFIYCFNTSPNITANYLDKKVLIDPTPAWANDNIPNDENGKHFRKIQKYAVTQKLNNYGLGTIVESIAFNLIGADYESNLLDKSPQEDLFISLTKFDCVLFVETVLALARGIIVEDYQYSTFTSNVSQQRYRDGNLEDYCSRLHYFSDWIIDNQNRGNLTNITKSIGGVELNKKFNFMSKHRWKYPQLKNSDNYQCIVEVEKKLNNVNLYYIPTRNIKDIYPLLQSGDIVAIATRIPGLDVTHTGLIYRHHGNVGLIHASPAGKVTLANDLQIYTSNVKFAIGVIVARPTY